MALLHRNPLFDTRPKRILAVSMLFAILLLYVILYGFRPVNRSHLGYPATGENSADGNRTNRIPVDPRR
jgi:hypothetical protein